MEYKFEVNQYVSVVGHNGEVLDRKQRKKQGLLVNLYLVNFDKTESATAAKHRFKIQHWYREDELRKVSGHQSNLEIWLAAIKRLIKNITGYEFNRKRTLS